MKQTSFTRNLDQAGNKTIFLILEELKKFSQRTVRVMSIYFALREYQHKDDSIKQCGCKIYLIFNLEN